MNHELNPAKPELFETGVTTEYGSIFRHGNIDYAVLAKDAEDSDEEYSVPIPKDVADKVALMLKLQDKVYCEGDVDASAVLQTFNCRKSVFVATGNLDLETSIIDTSIGSGEDILYAEALKLLQHDQGHLAIMSDYANFLDKMNEYDGTFPCVVHLFESDEHISEEMFTSKMKTLHRVHSFLVLGEYEKDDEVRFACFQKAGPAVSEPFMVVDLLFVTHLYRNQKNRLGCFVYGPVE